MPKTIALDPRVSRLRSLPRRDDLWQGAIIKMPGWITGERRPPYRPFVSLWASTTTGLVGGLKLVKPEDYDPLVALEGLVKFATDERLAGYAPDRVVVRQPEVAARLEEPLRLAGIELELVDEVPLVDHAARALGEDTAGPGAWTSPFDGEGVGVEEMRHFAEAACAFYRKRPWLHLAPQDVIRIESAAPVDASHCLVFGGEGPEHGMAIMGQEEARGLFEGMDPRELLGGDEVWVVVFGGIHDLPFPDADLWEDHALAVAEGDAYPLLIGHLGGGAGSHQRADAEMLGLATRLMFALSATTEDEMDAGRWQKAVFIGGGRALVELALPGVLDPPRHPDPGAPRMPDRRLMEREMENLHALVAEHEFDSIDEVNELVRKAQRGGKSLPRRPATTDRERAQDLIYEALEARGRLRLKLARRALALWPDCAEAYVLRAEAMSDLEERTRLFKQGMEAAERVLGPQAFEEHVGHFWGVIETRPYMRARLGYAMCRSEQGHVDECIMHLEELLRLNPGDNQGVRYFLIPRLLESDQDEAAEAALVEHGDEDSTQMNYARALVAYRREGDSAGARRARAIAVRQNGFAVKYLSGAKPLPEWLPDSYGFGSEEEAVLCANEQLEGWRKTPGAQRWLAAEGRGKRKQRGSGSGSGGGGRRGGSAAKRRQGRKKR